MTTQPSAALSPRSVVANAYQVHERLGEGGMAVVYRATQRLTGQGVALKVISDGDALPAEATCHDRTRVVGRRLALAREFQTLASLHHPHVVRVLDYGFDGECGPYYTMELLPEAQTVLQAGRGRPLAAKVTLLVQLLQALSYLHRRDILHRDVKPSNVLVVGGQVKLVDFGIAVRGDSGAAASGGTIEYMAPEVLLGGAPTVRADLYAAGLIAYQLLAEGDPFDLDGRTRFLRGVLGDSEVTLPGSVAEMLHRRFGASAPAPPEAEAARGLRELRPLEGLGDATPALEAVVRRLLAVDPADRYGAATDVIRDLAAAVKVPLEVETAETRESHLQAAEFVGREGELEELDRALDLARQGRGSGWLVGGESGVGKSRLLEELRTNALVKDVRVARGQAVTEASQQLALWAPILRLMCLDAPVDDRDAGVLVDVVPDLDAVLGRPIAPAPALGPQQAQARLFATIERLFRRQTRPTLVILEDLQWAGSESLLLLGQLARAAGETPVLIVGNYRNDERSDLPAMLPAMKSMTLGRLRAEGIARLAASILGPDGAPPRVVQYLERETEGNVFFVVEVVRALAERAGQLDEVAKGELRGGVLTGGIERVLGQRLARLPAEGQGLLKAAATAGRRLDPAVLRRLGPGVDVDRWLVACANAAVITAQEGAWLFAHDKLREWLLGRIDAEERRALHGRVAEAIEAVYPGAPEKVAALAQHYQRAGVPEKAYRYFRRAGDAAARLNALVEARALYTGALECLALLPPTPEHQRAAVDALVARQTVAWWSTKPEDSVAYMAEGEATLERLAASGAAVDEDQARLARVWYWKGRGYHVGGYPLEAVAHYQRVLPLAERLGDEEFFVMVASSVGQSYGAQGQFAACFRHLERTPGPLERAESWAEWVRVTAYAGSALAGLARLRESESYYQRAWARAKEIKHPTTLAALHLHLTCFPLFIEDWPRVLEAGRQLAAVATEARDHLLAYTGHRSTAWALSWLGQLDEGDAELRKAEELARTFGNRTILYDWFAVADCDRALNEGRPDGAIELAKKAIEVARGCGGVLAEGLAHRARARALYQKGAGWGEVEAELAQSLRIHEPAGALAPATVTHLQWAAWCRERGDAAAAEEHERKAAAYPEVAEFRAMSRHLA